MMAVVACVFVAASVSYDKECLVFYTKDACDQARVAWLPSFGEAAQWWQRGQATEVTQRDGFKYESRTPDTGSLNGDGPEDGTFFVVAADGGPPKGRVVYDQIHRIAFYEKGCCTSFEAVAASDVKRPPRKVVIRDLSGLTTVRGIRLGDSIDLITRIYGRAKPLSIPGHPDLVGLAYTTWPPLGKRVVVNTPCGQFEYFIFRRNHLIYIQFENGC